MNPSKLQLTAGVRGRGRKLGLCAVLVTLGVAWLTGPAWADRPRLVKRWAGGVCPFPIITSTTSTSTQSVSVNWTGFAGPYKVERIQKLGDTNWTQVGSTRDMSLTLSQGGPVGFFRVQAPSPNFAGAAKCMQCHVGHTSWSDTAHAAAYDSLKSIGMQKNASCLPCHTVGFGAPTGFINETNTPGLAGVQCESCHGPAGAHANNPDDLSVVPVKTQAAFLCGGCHTGEHNPQSDEWNTTLHAKVDAHVAGYFADPTNGPARMQSCGACHGGATRLAMLQATTFDIPVTLPSTNDATAIGVTCVVCHDPHVKSADSNQPFQLRSPLASMKPYSYNTSVDFASQYDSSINVCGQCHNLRGGKWTDTSRPPHHSPQYNMLIGSGGVESTNTPPQSYHRTNDLQCAQCHVTSISMAKPTPQNPNIRGHTFEPRMDACQPCHFDPQAAADQVESTQTDVKKRISTVKALLDQWAATKAPASLRTKYGALGWEFSTPGALSDPAGTLKGPTTNEQTNVPPNIKQARFNLYMVQHDASFGVHNGKYTRYLLKVAQDKVNSELGQ